VATLRSVRDRHGAYSDELRRRVFDGPGSLSATVRRSLASGAGVPEDLADFAITVREHPYDIADSMVDGLAASGYSGDEIYEATLSASLGAGALRLDAGMRALAESLTSTPIVEVAVVEVVENEPIDIDEPSGEIVVVADFSAPPLVRRSPGANLPEPLQ
jgi:hypothetical protein